MLRIKLSSSKNPFSLGVRAFTRSNFSHVDLDLDNGFYVGSQPGIGVVIHKEKCPFEQFFELDIPSDKVLEYAMSQVGKPYDYSGIYGFLFNRNWQHDDSWFCSELVAAAINKQEQMFKKDAFRVTPCDIRLLPNIKPVINSLIT